MNSTYTAIECLSKTKGGRGGVILNVSSLAGLNYLYGHPAYAASKHGVVGFTTSFGVNVIYIVFFKFTIFQHNYVYNFAQHKYYSNVYGITFLTICPGYTLTNIIRDVVKFDFDNEAYTKSGSNKRRFQT